jgi:hypothetical protein
MLIKWLGKYVPYAKRLAFLDFSRLTGRLHLSYTSDMSVLFVPTDVALMLQQDRRMCLHGSRICSKWIMFTLSHVWTAEMRPSVQLL